MIFLFVFAKFSSFSLLLFSIEIHSLPLFHYKASPFIHIITRLLLPLLLIPHSLFFSKKKMFQIRNKNAEKNFFSHYKKLFLISF